MDCVSLPYSAIHYLYSHYDHHSCDQKAQTLSYDFINKQSISN